MPTRAGEVLSHDSTFRTIDHRQTAYPGIKPAEERNSYKDPRMEELYKQISTGAKEMLDGKTDWRGLEETEGRTLMTDLAKGFHQAKYGIESDRKAAADRTADAVFSPLTKEFDSLEHKAEQGINDDTAQWLKDNRVKWGIIEKRDGSFELTMMFKNKSQMEQFHQATGLDVAGYSKKDLGPSAWKSMSSNLNQIDKKRRREEEAEIIGILPQNERHENWDLKAAAEAMTEHRENFAKILLLEQTDYQTRGDTLYQILQDADQGMHYQSEGNALSGLQAMTDGERAEKLDEISSESYRTAYNAMEELDDEKDRMGWKILLDYQREHTAGQLTNAIEYDNPGDMFGHAKEEAEWKALNQRNAMEGNGGIYHGQDINLGDPRTVNQFRDWFKKVQEGLDKASFSQMHSSDQTVVQNIVNDMQKLVADFQPVDDIKEGERTMDEQAEWQALSEQINERQFAVEIAFRKPKAAAVPQTTP